MGRTTSHELADRIASGDRRALARAVTLVESARPDHRGEAERLLIELRRRSQPALRIGLTGTPGVGKSTFIESLGLHLCDQGHRVAVLAVDPSSQITGGAILGDKTRMPDLSRRREAFIRPSPSQNQMGGVAAQSRAVIELLEAAGFDVVIVETVGVGQSETSVASMTDLFALLIAPAGGDELQGVKRGIMELADLVIVNKADGDLRDTAIRTTADYAGALRLLRRPAITPEGYPRALTMSAQDGTGLKEVWAAMQDLGRWRRENGVTSARRAAQAQDAFARALDAALVAAARDLPRARALIAQAQARIAAGEALPEAAAAEVASALIKSQ